ncbi:MAG: D-alanyl-D-alanine carboxypeptidase family protein [Enterococcus sp.]
MKKILGFISIIIMVGAAGVAIFGEHGKDTKAKETKTEEVKKSSQSKTATSTKTTTSSTTKKESESKLPDVKTTDWDLVLVGPDNKIQNEIDESTQLETLANGYQLDKRVVSSYEEFAQAAEAAGFPMAMVSGYRSVADQQQVFSQHVQEVMTREGVSEEDATTETKKTMTVPGYSEHHTGLALDVVDQDWYSNFTTSSVLDAGYGTQPGAKWIAANAYKYGFIVRYPDGKDDITKITYEPWHLRYVGKESAKYITENDLTLEEYLKLLKEK